VGSGAKQLRRYRELAKDADVPAISGKDLHQFPALLCLLVGVPFDVLNLLRVQRLVGVHGSSLIAGRRECRRRFVEKRSSLA